MDATLALAYAAGAVDAELDPVRGSLSWRDRAGRRVASAAGAVVLSWWPRTGAVRWAMEDPELQARGLPVVPALSPQAPTGPASEAACAELAAGAALELGYSDLARVREGEAVRFVAVAELALHGGLVPLPERLRALAAALRGGVLPGEAAWRLQALAADVAARVDGASGVEGLVLRALAAGLEARAGQVSLDPRGVAQALDEAAAGLDRGGQPDLSRADGLLGAVAVWMQGGARDPELAQALRGHLQALAAAPDAQARMADLLDAARQAGVPYEDLARALRALLPPGEGAAGLWRALAAAAPAQAELVTLFNLGLALQAEAGAAQEAAGLLARARDLDPSDPDVWFALGDARDAAGQPEEALAAWAEAARLQPALPGPWARRGDCLGRLGRDEEARQALARAAELDDGPEAWLAYGRVEARVGDPLAGRLAIQRAALGFTRRLEVGGPTARAHLGRGAAHLALGDLDGAFADLALAVSLDPALGPAARQDPTWADVHEHPRFRALTAT